MNNWIDYLVPISVSITSIGVIFGGFLYVVNLIIEAKLKAFETQYTKDFSEFKSRYSEDFSEFKSEYTKSFNNLELRLTKLLGEK